MAFEWRGGLIRYYYDHNRSPDTKADVLSFGIITPETNAVILLVNSKDTNDYLQVHNPSYKLHVQGDMSFVRLTCPEATSLSPTTWDPETSSLPRLV